MLIEDWMGSILFVFGLILITLGFLSAIQVTSVLTGLNMILAFSFFGFILCLTGFIMARAAMSSFMDRFRG